MSVAAPLRTLANCMAFLQSQHHLLAIPNDPVLHPRHSGAELTTGGFRALGLPASYIDFCCANFVENVQVGHVGLSPFCKSGLVDGLIAHNAMLPAVIPSTERMVVGAYEGDPIMVKIASHRHGDGSVFYQDISSGFFPTEVKIAASFQEFVILATNLYACSLKGNAYDLDMFPHVIRTTAQDPDDQTITQWSRFLAMSIA